MDELERIVIAAEEALVAALTAAGASQEVIDRAQWRMERACRDYFYKSGVAITVTSVEFDPPDSAHISISYPIIEKFTLYFD